MTFSPLPADPAHLLHHLSPIGLVRHALSALRLLDHQGVDLPPVAIDELEEVELELLSRIPGGLDTVPAATVFDGVPAVANDVAPSTLGGL